MREDNNIAQEIKEIIHNTERTKKQKERKRKTRNAQFPFVDISISMVPFMLPFGDIGVILPFIGDIGVMLPFIFPFGDKIG